MKNFTILISFLLFSSFIFSQELSKEDKSSKKHLEKNISVNKLDAVNQAGVLQYKNTVLTLEFKGISSQYQSSIESIGAYCIGTLYPLKNVSQVSSDGVQSISYYPQFQAYFDKSDNQMHAMFNLIIPKDAKLITIYNFDSENGNGLMMEFFVKNTGAYSYGFVLESELRILMDRVSKKEIGLMSDERYGRTYKWVMIGDQKWLGENLQYIIDEHKSMDLTVPYSNYFDRSIEFFLAGESRFAIDDINKAIELDGKNLEQKLFKAQILFLYSFEKDADEIRKLVAEYTNEVKYNDYAFYFQSRLALYDAGYGGLKVTSYSERRKKAYELIDKALAIDSENPFYNNYKAKLLVVNREYAAAIKALKKELEVDSKNGETHYWLAKMKLKNYHKENVKNNVKAGEWCTQITGMCFKLTPSQIKDACSSFKKAINYGAEVSPDYLTICAELKQAETLEKHKPIFHTGPRGGRYTMNSSGNKCYIPRR